jgi:hypothetical protein
MLPVQDLHLEESSLTTAVQRPFEARQALATTEIRPGTPEARAELDSLSSRAAAMSAELHLIADLQAGATRRLDPGPPSAEDRAVAYRVASQLHRAAEMLHQVATAIDHASRGLDERPHR